MTQRTHSGTPHTRSLLPRVLRATGAAGYVLLAGAGAVASPGVSWAAGLVCGSVAAAVVTALHRTDGAGLPLPPHPLVAGLVAGSVPAALGGAALLGAPAAATISAALVGVTVAGVRWALSEPRETPAPVPPAEDSLRTLLGALPTDVLLAEWRDVRGAPATPGYEDGPALLRTRDLLVAELRRRDPAGTARWLGEAPGDLPDRYLRADPGT